MATAAEVVASEVDERMVAHVTLRAKKEGFDNLQVIKGDCLKLAGDWPPFNCCVANLPYQVEIKIINHVILCRSPRPSCSGCWRTSAATPSASRC